MGGFYECNSSSYESDTFGLYWFQDINSGKCIDYDTVVLTGSAASAASVFDTLNWFCGGILVVWLLVSTCCPIRRSHKKILIAFAILACMSQALFFVFYANNLCKAHGCAVSRDGYFAVSGAIVFFITVLALLPIKPMDPSVVVPEHAHEQEHELPRQQEQLPEPEIKIDPGDEELRPSIAGVVT